VHEPLDERLRDLQEGLVLLETSQLGADLVAESQPLDNPTAMAGLIEAGAVV